MTDYTQLYKSKLITAEDVAAQVKSGCFIGMDAAVAQAPCVIDAVCKRAEAGGLEGVRVQTLVDTYPYAFYKDSSLLGKVTGESWFSSAGARNAINSGFADLRSGYYCNYPAMIRESVDFGIFLAEVSPMDKHGFFSMGTTSSYSEAAMEKAEKIFVVVNKNQPRAVRGLQIHVSRVAGIVEDDHELAVLPPVKIDGASETIGNLIAEQIPDGACIQLGIGAIPDATGAALMSKHDLGIHTEMFTDSMVGLIESGAVNNSKKQIDKGLSVATFAFGSKRIYDFVDDNPGIAILPVDYVNDPMVICRNDNMISINAAIEVDLFGQVCAESVGTKHMSGSGGQVDYVRGATMSRGGKSFIAFTSTAKGGAVSKIKSELAPGAVVTTSKNDVDYIVTEYGVAHLRNQPLSVRAKRLIEIAHPDFRDELTFTARKRGILI